MSEHDRDLNDLSAQLTQRASAGVSSADITDVVLDAWVQIGEALAPIVGSRAVSMLHQRTLHVTAATHAWLADSPDGLPDATDFDALRLLMNRQSGTQAAIGGSALLRNLLDLLASLVGSSLTERLLRSVWANLLGGSAAKDSPP